MNPLHKLLRWFGKVAGLIEDDYEHIVADFQLVKDKLAAHILRKQDAVVEATNEMARQSDLRMAAALQQSKSERTLNTLNTLFG